MRSAGLSFLRVAMGILMVYRHGWPKVQAFAERFESFPDPIGLGSGPSLVLAILAEVGCSVLLILGLGTRLAAIPLAITMSVAFFVVHAADEWAAKELALVYLIVYVTLILGGGGCCSLDALIWRKWKGDRDVAK